MIRSLAYILAAVAAVALAARVDVPVPGSPVPQSLQTLAVVLTGAALGPARGSLAMAVYLLAGVVGAPVFADGASGFEVLGGPTGGYLFGFLIGAALVGGAARREGWGWDRFQGGSWFPERKTASALRAGAVVSTASLAAHAVILGLGWARLGTLVGRVEAFSAGVVPFLAGAVVKSVAAGAVWAVIALVAGRGVDRRGDVSPG